MHLDSEKNSRRCSMEVSLTMLDGLVWNERNAWVFQQKSTPPPVIFGTIKREVKFWVIVGATKLGNIMSGD